LSPSFYAYRADVLKRGDVTVLKLCSQAWNSRHFLFTLSFPSGGLRQGVAVVLCFGV